MDSKLIQEFDELARLQLAPIQQRRRLLRELRAKLVGAPEPAPNAIADAKFAGRVEMQTEAVKACRAMSTHYHAQKQPFHRDGADAAGDAVRELRP